MASQSLLSFLLLQTVTAETAHLVLIDLEARLKLERRGNHSYIIHKKTFPV